MSAIDIETVRLGQDNRDFAWMLYAGVVLLVLGCSNIVEGVAGVDGSSFFVSHARYLFGDLNSWGWALWLVGVAQGLTAVGVLLKIPAARWLGIGFAALNALTQLLVIQQYPFWSLALLALNILVIYALAVHGARSYRAA